jgi:heptosyltransferase-3
MLLPAGTPLIIRFGALGDMVLNTPVLRALAVRHGQPCAVACIGSWVPSLYQNLPFVGEVRTIKSRGAPYWLCPDQWRLVEFLRQFRGHPVYLFDIDEKSYWLARRAGLTLTSSMRTTPHRDNQHQVEVQARVCTFVAPTGSGSIYSSEFTPSPELIVSASELAQAQAWCTSRFGTCGTVVLVHMGNKKTMGWRQRSGNLKEWPTSHWLTVVRAVRARLPHAHILLSGNVHEAKMTVPLAAQSGDERVISIAGQTPLRRLLALMRLAHSTISVDTGPAHAAAAIGCPLVVMFGQTDPRVNRPLSNGSPVHVVTGPPGAPELDGEAGWRAHHHMSGITPDAVITAWISMSASLPGQTG